MSEEQEAREWQAMTKHIQDAFEEMEPVQKLLDAGVPKAALDKLTYMLNCKELAEEDRWIAFLHKAKCYRAMLEKENSLACMLEAVRSIAGQTLFAQKTLYGSMLFSLYELDLPDDEIRRLSFGFEELNRQAILYRHDRAVHARHSKVRIGYIANRFNENVVTMFSIQLFCVYDRERFEIYCYSYQDVEDGVTAMIRANVHKYYVAPYGSNTPPDMVARQIYEDGIDILFDLIGHTENSQGLMAAAYKPAPVQLTGIGFMGTSGLRAMDYFLGDPYCDPPGLNEDDFSERILRLPRSHFCYNPRALRGKGAYRPKQQGGEILLASFCNLRKLTPHMLEVWAEVLRRLPQAKLLLRSSARFNSYVLRKIKGMFRKAGGAADRLMLEQPGQDYLSRYYDVDLLLDTYPYVGGGTTCDALYMGVPVVSLYGRRHGTRFGYSLLMNTGLEELTASTENEYIEKAVALAGDTELLAALHSQIPKMFRQSPIMDVAGYMRDIESAYERIWQEWLSGSG